MNEERARLRNPSPSMLQAAADLRSAAQAAGNEGWIESARAAIRRAMLAVERELGEMNPSGSSMAANEPRLIPAMEQAEAGLAEMLLLLWTATNGSQSDLNEIARQFQHLADRTFDVFQESLVSTGGSD